MLFRSPMAAFGDHQGLNEFSDRETVRGFAGRDRQVLAQESASLRGKYGAGFENASIPYRPYSRSPLSIRISRHEEVPQATKGDDSMAWIGKVK